MKQIKNQCSVSGCRFDRAYAVVDETKIWRITFSKSLADKIAKQTGKQSVPVQLIIGDKIDDIDQSDCKLFAICKSKSKWPLRVTGFKDLAKMWELPGNRDIYQCYVKL